jgi:uncharacterized protein Yka (UPF0111/DUF47 family)
MDTKEKAEDLIDSFSRDGYDIVMSEKLAIRCALIAVNEIISLVGRYSNYWQEVKQEIENFKSIA